MVSDKIKKDRYDFVSCQWNNLIGDGKDIEIWSKYLFKGLDLVRDYDPEFAVTMEKMYNIYLKRRAKELVVLALFAAIVPQIMPNFALHIIPSIKSKLIGC